MKKLRKVMCWMMLTAVLFASLLHASAIDFTAEEKYESVFVIHSGNSLGSGFAIGSNCVVTNAHVVDDPNQVTVFTYDGRECEAQILGMDEDQDIAILVTDIEFPVLKVADLSAMQTGDDVFAIGAPKSMAYTLTKGVISAKEREVGKYVYIQTDAPINEGNSGGPLLSATGEVLGMNTLKMNNSEGIGLAIPVDHVCQYLRDLGVTLDENGNVTGILPREHEHSHEEEQPRQDGSGTVGIFAPVAILAVLAAGLSMALNVVLLVAVLILSGRLRKITKATRALPVQPVQPVQPAQTVSADPSERTDFDIDILE